MYPNELMNTLRKCCLPRYLKCWFLELGGSAWAGWAGVRHQAVAVLNSVTLQFVALSFIGRDMLSTEFSELLAVS